MLWFLSAFLALFLFSCTPPQQLDEQLTYATITGYVNKNSYPVEPSYVVAFYQDDSGKIVGASSPISSSGYYSVEVPEGKEYTFVVFSADGTPLGATYGATYLVSGDGEMDFTMNTDKSLSTNIRTPGSIFEIANTFVQDSNGNVLPDNIEKNDVYVNVPSQSIDTDGDGVADLIIPEHTAPANFDYDRNGNGKIDLAEDLDGNGIVEGKEDFNGNGTPDILEDRNGNGIPDYYENNPGYLVYIPEQRADTDGDGTVDLVVPAHYAPAKYDLDRNSNSKLDIIEDIDGNGVVEAREDNNGDGKADILEDENANGVPDYYDIEQLPVDSAYAIVGNANGNQQQVQIPIIESPLVYTDQIHKLFVFSCADCHRPNSYADTIVGKNSFHVYAKINVDYVNPSFDPNNVRRTYDEMFNPPTPPYTTDYSTFAVKYNPDNSLVLLKGSNDIDHNGSAVWDKEYRAYQLVYNWLRQGAYYDYYTFRNNVWSILQNNCMSCHYQRNVCDPNTGVCTDEYGSAILAGARFKVYDGYTTCDWNGNCTDDDPRLTYDNIINNGLADTNNTYADAKNALLLKKASNESPHGGGLVLDPNSAEYKALRVWIWHGKRW